MPKIPIFTRKKEGAVLSKGFYCTSCMLILSGCHEEALGMENRRIPDSAIKANYQVNAIHVYTCVLFNDISGGSGGDTFTYFYRKQI